MKLFNMNGLMKKTFNLFIILGVLYTTDVNAQRFKGTAVFGLNLAQIDGDALAGFSKLGLTGGVKLAYPIKENMDINLEMLYSQRGSNAGFGFGNQDNSFTDLKYIEIPIYVDLKDWFIEDDDYHKVSAHAGLNMSYLFDIESSNGSYSNNIDNYNRYNIGYLLGVGYMFTKKLGASVRYSRAFNSIVDNKSISYWVTIRTEYTF